MNKKLSQRSFYLSQLTLLLTSIALIITFYFFLNDWKFVCPTNFNFICSAQKNLKNYLPVSKKPVSFKLDINNPEDELLVFEKSLVVSGQTSPFASVIISTPTQDLGIEANIEGEFSKIINLDLGLNEILITSIDEQGNNKTENRTVYFSEEKI